MNRVIHSWDSTQNKRKRFLPRIINNELDSNEPIESLKDFKVVGSKRLQKDCFITDDGGLANFHWVPDSDKFSISVIDHTGTLKNAWSLIVDIFSKWIP